MFLEDAFGSLCSAYTSGIYRIPIARLSARQGHARGTSSHVAADCGRAQVPEVRTLGVTIVTRMIRDHVDGDVDNIADRDQVFEQARCQCTCIPESTWRGSAASGTSVSGLVKAV